MSGVKGRVDAEDGGVTFTNGVATKISTANVNDATPTAAELIAAFGAAADNAGKVLISDDAGADARVKLVLCNGTSYYFVALTKAT